MGNNSLANRGYNDLDVRAATENAPELPVKGWTRKPSAADAAIAAITLLPKPEPHVVSATCHWCGSKSPAVHGHRRTSARRLLMCQVCHGPRATAAPPAQRRTAVAEAFVAARGRRR